ncbi:uncharacterized protein CTHT_0015740 [Thermochaetoides thermophila DSM 1495]|uniref:Extracellular protein n=1 Tax=Chaetomium thermophilum (strain DSM 1495 / CBS 144.50 / IMI 039719) TaxID=759272 RepID=G0S225_CHATD|nr:hypothetical protein CTHT_0015740 [Thermochaetoides thermophila DSM 1495]EGS23085.1 hypothetical protein CTHT_0015740 [Thermochaetoides thermophila DSM 1495]
MLSNIFTTGALVALLAGSQLASAHMEIRYPPPFRSKFNKFATDIDYTNTAPLAADGSNYPCKGYHVDMGTAAGEVVDTWAPGARVNFTVEGSAPHGGGSCQVSLSYDGGKTFTVIHSIIGDCPNSKFYEYNIPDDAPEGVAIWAWTWNNQIGNREQYMNCAAVRISRSAAKRDVPVVAKSVEEQPKKEAKRASVPFSSRPPVFIANIGNGCVVPEGIDVEYPNPGPDVVVNPGHLGKPQGNCGAPAAAPAPIPDPTPAPAPTPTPTGLPGGVFVTVSPSSSSQVVEQPVTTSVVENNTPTPAPTTLITTTAVPTPTPAPTEIATPAPTPGSGSGSGSGSGNTNGGSGSAYAVGAACTNEGAWNCVNGGTAFQRCASGRWSAVISMAAGTKCVAGESSALAFSVKRDGEKVKPRFRGGAKMILA